MDRTLRIGGLMILIAAYQSAVSRGCFSHSPPLPPVSGCSSGAPMFCIKHKSQITAMKAEYSL
jgi:hypothetical protein